MSKGGRTSTTWNSGGSWRSGRTKTIRIPVALENEILAYARALDDKAVSHGNNAEIILCAIARYIEHRKATRHANQHTKELDININSRTWDELRKFQKLVEEQPDFLG